MLKLIPWCQYKNGNRYTYYVLCIMYILSSRFIYSKIININNIGKITNIDISPPILVILKVINNISNISLPDLSLLILVVMFNNG